MVAQFPARLKSKGLDVQGIDLLLDWAAPDLRKHETLLFSALFEKATGLVLNVCSENWRFPDKSAYNATPGQGEAPDEEGELRRQIEECERKLADLRGPMVPPFSGAAVTQFAAGSLPWIWQRDAVAAGAAGAAGGAGGAGGEGRAGQVRWVRRAGGGAGGAGGGGCGHRGNVSAPGARRASFVTRALPVDCCR